MNQEIVVWLDQAVQAKYKLKISQIELSVPEEKFGDYSTNIALKLTGQLKKPPIDIANQLVEGIKDQAGDQLKNISVTEPGFINLTLSDPALLRGVQATPRQTYRGQKVLVEFSDPNPFKILHVGHVYTTVVGEAIANLIEATGGEVTRLNYGGDVGLHVAKTMAVVLKRLGGEEPGGLGGVKEAKRAKWLSSAYVEGNLAYEQDQATKQLIDELNQRIYQIHQDNDKQSNLAVIYWTCRDWSYQVFDNFYNQLDTKIDRYYKESQVAWLGLKLVKENIPAVFSESDGAIIYQGDKAGLHTRVFVTRAGLPTYEAKEIGLLAKKEDDYQPDISFIVTGNEQEQYLKVVLKAASAFMPEAANKTSHIPHGMVRLAGGLKMSSRLGNITTADSVFEMTARASQKAVDQAEPAAVSGAIKYAFLKFRLGSDLIYDPNESVSLEGNSGPYLQYAHARAQSILKKAKRQMEAKLPSQISQSERRLMLKISAFAQAIDQATDELKPSFVTSYLYELAQIFNRFYEAERVIGSETEAWRLFLVKAYADKLKAGLALLGIEAPDSM